MFKHRLAIAALCTSLLMPSVRAADTDPSTAFTRGVAAFNARHFDAAVESFERASAAVPQSAEYLHWLGRAYGRLAEQSSWLTAIELARKTCTAFERAYALDPNDIGTVEDLIEYYTEAPGFLGGSAEKANVLKVRLEELKRDDGSKTVSAEPGAAQAAMLTR